MDVRELVDYSLLTFTSVFCVANPIGVAAAFGATSEEWSAEERIRTARRAVVGASLVLLAAGWIGNIVALNAHIHTGGVRVAGGLLVLWSSLRLAMRGPVRLAPPDPRSTDRAVGAVPSVALSLASAPAMGTVLLYSGEWFELWRRAVTLISVAVTCAAAYLLLRKAAFVRAALGYAGARWVSAAFALVSAAWAADFTAIGVRDLLPLVLETPPAR